MPEFIAKTYDHQGKKSTQRRRAANETEAIHILSAEHFVIQSIHPVSDTRLSTERVCAAYSRQLILFTRQLAELLKAGVHLGVALHILSGQVHKEAWQNALRQIESDVLEGESLSQAMQGQGSFFSPLYISLIQVGETGGALTDVLTELTKYLEREEAWRTKLREAMIYPCMIMAVACLAVILLMVKVVPTFAGMFAEAGLSLPLISRGLIGFSVLLKQYGVLFLFFLLMAALLFRWWSNSPSGKLIWQRQIFRLPVIGAIFYQLVIGRMMFSLALLMRTGIPLLRALEVTMTVVNNAAVERMLAETSRQVLNGRNLSQTLGKSALLDAASIHMISVGEETGTLEQMLSGLSNFYDTQLQHSLSSALTLVEPILMLVAGLVVGVIVIAALLPMFDFMQVL